MSLTRRQALASAAGALASTTLASPAIAAKEPIRIGYLPALTGPSSSTGIGIGRATELAHKEKVSVVLGPLNSGESLAVVPLLARANMLQVHPCWVDTLTDPKK